ncbi:hypothetical protein MKX08_003464 [Trichoderma sp. CBMAI-0020]|nr:hypothetical protein MKX08_003464 [Trichoderma sp. CBMAI-0020]WOD46467.1 hypothetical protein [Trichoderma atroviride]
MKPLDGSEPVLAKLGAEKKLRQSGVSVKDHIDDGYEKLQYCQSRPNNPVGSRKAKVLHSSSKRVRSQILDHTRYRHMHRRYLVMEPDTLQDHEILGGLGQMRRRSGKTKATKPRARELCQSLDSDSFFSSNAVANTEEQIIPFSGPFLFMPNNCHITPKIIIPATPPWSQHGFASVMFRNTLRQSLA